MFDLDRGLDAGRLVAQLSDRTATVDVDVSWVGTGRTWRTSYGGPVFENTTTRLATAFGSIRVNGEQYACWPATSAALSRYLTSAG